MSNTQQFEIIYYHDDFIVVNKPIDVSVHRDDAEQGFIELLCQQERYDKLWLVHRLDKVTSGLIILATNREAAAILSGYFAEHLVKKHYIAIAKVKPKKKQGLISGDMQKSRNGSWKLLHTLNNPAITRFYSYSCEPQLRLFHLLPQTGKTHQLRVMMKSISSPILGDKRYTGESADRVYLHAYALQFSYQGNEFILKCLPTEGEYFKKVSVLDRIRTLELN